METLCEQSIEKRKQAEDKVNALNVGKSKVLEEIQSQKDEVNSNMFKNGKTGILY